MPAMGMIKDPDLFSSAWRWLRGDLITAYKNLYREKNRTLWKHREPDQRTKTGKCLGAKSTQLQNENKVAMVLKVKLVIH